MLFSGYNGSLLRQQPRAANKAWFLPSTVLSCPVHHRNSCCPSRVSSTFAENNVYTLFTVLLAFNRSDRWYANHGRGQSLHSILLTTMLFAFRHNDKWYVNLIGDWNPHSVLITMMLFAFRRNDGWYEQLDATRTHCWWNWASLTLPPKGMITPRGWVACWCLISWTVLGTVYQLFHAYHAIVQCMLCDCLRHADLKRHDMSLNAVALASRTSDSKSVHIWSNRMQISICKCCTSQ